MAALLVSQLLGPEDSYYLIINQFKEIFYNVRDLKFLLITYLLSYCIYKPLR